LDIAKEMKVETVYCIMLPDNYRALSLTKKMGFSIEYSNDGTVKGILDLKAEDAMDQCRALQKSVEPPHEKAEGALKQEEKI
ncbi:MAG: hypothetical protein ACQXXJ_06525, partial [Candidatus Bathyarchaeia archaeon]